jgi:hypothetical protein
VGFGKGVFAGTGLFERFAAARFVLIFGIESLLCNVHPPRWCRRVGSKTAVA